MILLAILGIIFAGIVGVVEFAKAHHTIKGAEYILRGKDNPEVSDESW